MDSGLRRPAVAAPDIELVSVASARDVAQASLVLGEQRAWIEHVTGLDLADVQPDEYGNLLDWYRPPAGRLLLARLDGEPVGVIGLRRQQDGVAQLRRLYVRPGARGRGVARRLVNEALRAAGLMGAALVYVETAPWSMPTAVRLLRRLGFTEGARRYMATIDGVVAMQRLVASAAVSPATTDLRLHSPTRATATSTSDRAVLVSQAPPRSAPTSKGAYGHSEVSRHDW